MTQPQRLNHMRNLAGMQAGTQASIHAGEQAGRRMDIETGRQAAQAKTLHQTCTPEVFNALVCKG